MQLLGEAADPGDKLHLEAVVGEQVSANLGMRIGAGDIANGHASIPGVPTRLQLSCRAAPRF